MHAGAQFRGGALPSRQPVGNAKKGPSTALNRATERTGLQERSAWRETLIKLDVPFIAITGRVVSNIRRRGALLE
jgi:hypothetical protein